MTAQVERRALRPGVTLSRLIKGNWQLAGDHGPVDRDRAIDDLFAFVDAGVTTFDGADIYTGVEQLLGDFRRRFIRERGASAARELRFHTKFVPDRSALAEVDRAYVERIIDRSLARLASERLDLVQFHWWDYAVPGAIDTYGHLESMREAGKIAHIGVTNFDLAHVRALQGAGEGLLSAQVQFSLLDNRPALDFARFCAEQDIAILCYGVLAGGFLTERWLGAANPGFEFENRSLIKYRLIIEDFGGWSAFQALLRTLKDVGDRHGVALSTVAIRAMLERAEVAAVIIGARYGAHLREHLRAFEFELDPQDKAMLQNHLARASGPSGEVYGLEREPSSVHAGIMKYDLNDGDPNQLANAGDQQ